MRTLGQLLQPYSVDDFLSENWTKRAIAVPAEHSDKFKHLFSWEQLNHLLNYHQLEPRFVLNDNPLPPCDPQEWVTRCQQGASLVVSQLQHRVPALANLVWAIQQEMGHKAIHTNVYCSWPSKQGFKIHYDSHEVFVLQIDGKKEWFVFEDTVKHPYREEKSEYHTPPDSEPYLHTVLEPGDLLYIPRGHWHYAIACEQPSLHVTMGIRCFNGRDILENVTKFLQDHVSNEAVLRQNLPLFNDGNTAEMSGYVENLLEHLINKLTEEKETITEKFVSYQPQIQTHAGEISLPGQVGFSPFEKGLDTVLRQPKFQTLTIEPIDELGYLLITPKKKLKLKGLPPQFINTLIERLQKQVSFTIREIVHCLPEWDVDTQILPLLAGLIQEGILIEDTSETVVNFPESHQWSVNTAKEKPAETVIR
jgi:ribosomal protein L16 Arg81 hydroxylase